LHHLFIPGSRELLLVIELGDSATSGVLLLSSPTAWAGVNFLLHVLIRTSHGLCRPLGFATDSPAPKLMRYRSDIAYQCLT
jgi:hypothetical protein